jgi:UDP-N-acetyl-D-glucosamine dehydrogenase
MIKLVENTFRFVSIGFANEMARIARAFGLNVWEIIRVARTKGFGLDLCYPGLIGGHCIPIDPHYLDWAVRRRRLSSAYIGVAERAHQLTRVDAISLIRRLLNHQKKDLYGARILFFGIAYKKNVSDFRESPSLDLMKGLFERGSTLSF